MATVDCEVYLERHNGTEPKQIALTRVLGRGTYVAKNKEYGLFIEVKRYQGNPLQQLTMELPIGVERVVDFNEGIGRLELQPDTWLVVKDNNTPKIP